MNQKTLLIVDDDRVTRDLLQEVLQREGFTVQTAESAEAAIEILKVGRMAVVISDIRMAEMDGLGLLRQIKKTTPETSVILMTGFGNLEGAVDAIRLGAFDYVSKPFEISALKALVHRAFEQWQALRASARFHKSPPSPPTALHKQLTGRSSKMVEIYKTIARASLSESTVLILGESGTGKELAAQTIHDKSGRKDHRFVAVNCGALTESLLESELFGHIKGAFTGAHTNKKGLFEEAHGGTLFLDEVGELTPALQVKLLRAIQEGEIKPVGSADTKRVNVRVIAATHRDLPTLIKDGKFREDLYYRFRVITLEMPPLRSRKEDIPDLVGHFVSVFSGKNQKAVSHLSDPAMDMLLRYDWPGNVRELQNAVERAVALARTQVLHPEDFHLDQMPTAQKQTLESMEREHICKALESAGFNKSRAATMLGIDRATLYRKAQKFGITL